MSILRRLRLRRAVSAYSRKDIKACFCFLDNFRMAITIPRNVYHYKNINFTTKITLNVIFVTLSVIEITFNVNPKLVDNYLQ